MSLLSDYLSTRLIPWSFDQGKQRFIVAQPVMSQLQLPEGVKLVERQIVGQRVIVRNRRFWGNVRTHSAAWPQAGLDEWENYKMICVLTGRADIQLGKYAVQCGEGFYLVLPPRIPQPNGREMFFHAENASCTILQILLQRYAIQCVLTDSSSQFNRTSPLENYVFRGEQLQEIFQCLVKGLIGGGKIAERASHDLVNAFWKILQCEVEDENYILPGPLWRADSLDDGEGDFMAELSHYVKTHLKQPLTLENVAHDMFLSRTQFIRRVRQETGRSFVQFLTDYRITEAKTLLRDSDWTITTISDFLGFKTPSYFHHVFSRQTGQTPGEYRAQEKKK